MHVGIYATTHGIMYRDDTNAFLRSLSASAMQPVRIAQLIEQLGFHSCVELGACIDEVLQTSLALEHDQRARALAGEPRGCARDLIDHLALLFGGGSREERVLAHMRERAPEIVLE